MACLRTFVSFAVKFFLTRFLTTELGSLGNLTRNSLLLLLTVTRHGNVDIARGTRTRVAQNVTSVVSALRVFQFLAVLSTGMRQNQGVEIGLIESSAVTLVLWK